MATNKILPFAQGPGANVITDAKYAELTALLADGFLAGIAHSDQMNKVWRQSSVIAAGVAQFLADNQAVNIDDSLTAANLSTYLSNALSGYMSPQLHGRNVIMNGDCSISQVNGTTLLTPANAAYPIDNVQFNSSQASKLQAQQVNTLFGALGAVSSLRTTVLAKYTPLAADYMYYTFPIEGYNFARFQYGTANAKAGSLQFKAVASVSGTYSGSIRNYAETRSYPFSFALVAGVETLVKIENIPGDTGGAWIGATNAGAAVLVIDLGSGTNLKTAANVWAAGNYAGVTGALALVDQVNGSTLAITDVQFEVGAFCTQFERKLYDQNLRECQRYYEEGTGRNYTGITGGTGYLGGTSFYKVGKRVNPTVTVKDVAGTAGKCTLITGTNGASTHNYSCADVASDAHQVTFGLNVNALTQYGLIYFWTASARI